MRSDLFSDKEYAEGASVLIRWIEQIAFRKSVVLSRYLMNRVLSDSISYADVLLTKKSGYRTPWSDEVTLVLEEAKKILDKKG